MKTIKTGKLVELIINKSKFLSCAFNVQNKAEIVEILNDYKQKFSDATHICYAYSFYENNVLLEKFSDDNEPNSTAGKPILNVIKKNELNNILIIVVRYFGGIKLGAGGLVRAYTKSAVLAVDNCKQVEQEYFKKYEIKLNYEHINMLYNLASLKKLKILENFDNNFLVLINEKDEDSLSKIETISLEFKEIEEWNV